MKPIIGASVVLAGSLLAVPLASSPAQTPGEEDLGKLSIVAKPRVVTYGGNVDITGRLTEAKQTRGIPVTLEVRQAPFEGRRYELLSTGPTQARGAYAFKDLEPIVNARYRASAPLAQATSKRILVEVRIAVTLRVEDSNPGAGSRVELSGTVAPDHDERSVQIQRRAANGRWKTVARELLRDAGDERSEFRLRWRVERDGVYRARAAHGADHAVGTSNPKAIDVR